MQEDAEQKRAKEELYELYDRYRSALLDRDGQALLRCVDPEAYYSVGSADGLSRWEGTGQEAVERLLHELGAIADRDLDVWLDVYAVAMRSAVEGVAVLERWIDDTSGRRRRTTLAVETARRSADGAWRVWRSAAEETVAPL